MFSHSSAHRTAPSAILPCCVLTVNMARSAALVLALFACGAALMAGTEAAATPASPYRTFTVRAYVNTKLRATYLKGANATKGFSLDFDELPANVK